jgi:hypothetical protein
MMVFKQAFTSNGNETLIAINPYGQLFMGQRDGFSFMDRRIANLQYNCTGQENGLTAILI